MSPSDARFTGDKFRTLHHSTLSPIARAVDPALRQSLPPTAAASMAQALAHGLHQVYLIGGLLVLLVAAMALRLPPGLSPVRPAR